MRYSGSAILAGFLLAVLGAAAVAMIFGLPLAQAHAGETPIWHLLRTALPVAAFALPGALTAIMLAEARRVRGLPYWLFVGAVLAAVSFVTLVRGGGAEILPQSMRSFMTLFGMGLTGGFLYWWLAGKKSGHFATALALASHGNSLDEDGLRKRCRACTAMTLLLGLLPLALLGWHMIYKPSPMLPWAIAARAEIDGTQQLTDAGLPGTKFSIDNYVGHITGFAADDTARTKAFDKAKSVLKPMLGGMGILPSVVAYLQNDIVVPVPGTPAEPLAVANNPPREEAAKLKADADARLAVEQAKRKADDAAAAAKAEADARQVAEAAAEAKARADEASAKAKAEQEVLAVAEEARRKADELTAQAKREEDSRLAAEAKLKADAKAKAEEELRQAAKANADAAKAKAVAEEQKQAETEKLAAEAEAKRLQDAADAAKKLAEVQIKLQAAEGPTAAVPAVPVPAAVASADAQCASAFGDLFRSFTIHFRFRSSRIDSEAADYLDRVAAVGKQCSGYSLDISGHTDRTGDAAFNQVLGQQRAISVRDALVKRGIASERLNPQGYASERPFDPARTRAAFKLNRRVDFGASITQPLKDTAKQVTKMPVDQCNTEFSRAFLADTIRFVGSSALVTDAYGAYLDRIASLLARCATYTLAVNGHTDRRGSAAFNQILSQERAIAVRQALVDRGVAATRLSANGYGGDRPFDPGDSPGAYALNRRVDFGAAVQAPKK